MTNHNNQLFKYIIKLSKEDSSFLYFILESNDNLCFYSTLDHKIGDADRSILIYGTIQLHDEFKKLLEYLSQKISFEIITHEIVLDGEKHE